MVGYADSIEWFFVPYDQLNHDIFPWAKSEREKNGLILIESSKKGKSKKGFFNILKKREKDEKQDSEKNAKELEKEIKDLEKEVKKDNKRLKKERKKENKKKKRKQKDEEDDVEEDN